MHTKLDTPLKQGCFLKLNILPRTQTTSAKVIGNTIVLICVNTFRYAKSAISISDQLESSNNSYQLGRMKAITPFL